MKPEISADLMGSFGCAFAKRVRDKDEKELSDGWNVNQFGQGQIGGGVVGQEREMENAEATLFWAKFVLAFMDPYLGDRRVDPREPNLINILRLVYKLRNTV